VIDSGPGVPDEYKIMLFDRYVQVRGRKGARRGTGLGLTFCRLVTETHGGQIWIDDNPMGGSIFAFTMPVSL
ncbi:MAG: ATP-binding protein, partial [Chloroflexota bacterium]